MRSTRAAAKETMEVLMIIDAMGKAGLDIHDKASAEALIALGAKMSSYANGKTVTPKQWRAKLDRVMEIYRGDPEAARMIDQISAALDKKAKIPHQNRAGFAPSKSLKS